MEPRRPTENLMLGFSTNIHEESPEAKGVGDVPSASEQITEGCLMPEAIQYESQNSIPHKRSGTLHLGIDSLGSDSQKGEIQFSFPDCKSPRADAAFFLPRGTMLHNGRYKIEEHINRGGFGLVYRAHDSTLNITVAIKELFPPMTVTRIPGNKDISLLDSKKKSEYEYLLDRFMLEARTMAKFSNHPNIVSIIDSFMENRTAYIVMEYLEGCDLVEYLESKRISDEVNPHISLDEAIEITSKVLVGLNAIHKKKIIHRDIKPENIRIYRDDNTLKVKLFDFGAARFSPDEKDVLTSYSNVVTAGFAPPEQYRSNSRQSAFTDLYAVGALFRYMLTGEPPIVSTDREAVTQDPMLPLCSVCDFEIPEHIDKAITRAMEPNGGLRFQTANKLRWAIEGKIKVRTWREEKRYNRRVKFSASAIIVALCVILILGLNYYRTDYSQGINIDGILGSSASINMYVPVKSEVDDDTKLAMNAMWNSIDVAFSEYLSAETDKKIDVEVTMLDKDEYQDSLNSSSVKGEPCIYSSEYEIDGESESLDILERIIPETEYLFYDQVFETSEGAMAFPYGFDATVMYVNTKYLRNTSVSVEALVSIEEIEAAMQMIDSDILKDPISVCESEQNYYKKFAAEAMTGLSFPGIEEFCNGQSLCYIGLASEIHKINERMPGNYAVTIAPNENSVIHIYPVLWSINSHCTEDEKKAAQIFLAYLFTEEAQDIMFLQQEGVLPVNLASIEQFVDYNPKLAFLFENTEKFEFVS